MTALVGSKQEQCVAETSRIQPAADCVPKISLMFTLSAKQRPETHYKWRLTAVICTFLNGFLHYSREQINQSHSSVQQVRSSQWFAGSKGEKKSHGTFGEIKGIAGNPKFYKSLGLGLLKMYRKKEWVGEWGLAGKKDKATEDCQNTRSRTKEKKKNTVEKNKQARDCQAVAQQRYFPLCAQLDLWDGEQYSPLLSRLWHKQGNLAARR